MPNQPKYPHVPKGSPLHYVLSQSPKNVYPEYIMKVLRQSLDDNMEPDDTSRDAEIYMMSHNEAFRRCLEWEGIIGYQHKIKAWITDIFGVKLD